MAGGHMKYRALSRDSAHRQALLRNLVTSLIREESIHTTWPKAKEAQRLAEKLITMAKKNNEQARRNAQAIFYTPDELLPKLFGEIRERYANRPGGYTRVLRTEPKDKYDQAPSAILELVDGPKDMRFAMTAATVARDRKLGKRHTDWTVKNIAKVTQFREEGRDEFEKMVEKVGELKM
ncbi:ribosomal protein L17 [Cladorrhinum sp. PSN332]|nr:ribosomal protein L17 [Cladorrhinum sp. PSN332]